RARRRTRTAGAAAGATQRAAPGRGSRGAAACRPARSSLWGRLRFFRGRRPADLRGEEQLAKLADGAAACRPPRNPLHLSEHLRDSVLGGTGEGHLAQRGKIVDVVAHVGGLLEGNPEVSRDLLDRRSLRPARPDHAVDRQLAAPLLDEVGAATCEHRELHPTVQVEQAQPVAVAHVECLECLAFLSVVEPPVGQGPVHVEDDEPDAPQQRARRIAGHQVPRARRMRRASPSSASHIGNVSEFGPSLSARSGSSCTSQKSASIPTAAAALASTGASARSAAGAHWDGSWTSVSTGRPTSALTRARMRKPSFSPGPRNDFTLVRFALSKLLLKTTAIPCFCATSATWCACRSADSSPSITQGP